MTVEGIEIDAPAEKGRVPNLLLTHGAGGNLSSPGLKAFSSALAGKGHLCVRANLPYRQAGRKSPPSAEKSVPGFRRAFDEVRAELGPDSVWVAGGRSYGGRVASMAAAEGLDTAGLIFFPYPLHRPGDPDRPRIDHWRRISVPCLFIQGTKDPFCDVAVLEKSMPVLGAESMLLLVEGGDHSLRVGAGKGSSAAAKREDAVFAEIMEDVLQWLGRLTKAV